MVSKGDRFSSADSTPGVSIQCIHVWTIARPPDFYRKRCGSAFASAKQRHLHFPQLGQLAYMLCDSRAGYPRLNEPFEPCDPAGSYWEFREEPFDFRSASQIHWDQPRLSGNEGLSHITKGERLPWPRLMCSKRHKVDLWPPSQATGEVESPILGRASGPRFTASVAGVGQWPGPRPHDASFHPKHVLYSCVCLNYIQGVKKEWKLLLFL